MAEGKILELKRWETVRYLPEGEGGAVVTIDLKRVKRHEAKALRKVVLSTFEELERSKADGLSATQKAEIIAAVFDDPSDDLRRVFGEAVGKITGLTIGGEAIDTAAKLLDEPDDEILFFILMSLNTLCKLSSAEAFRSASPSTSSAEAAPSPASSSAGVSPIESEASTALSTAQEIKVSPVSFTAAVES